MTSEATIQAIAPASVRKRLERHLQERRDILRELEPHANPGVDPVAYQTAAANRRVVDQIVAALGRLDAGTYGRCNRCGERIASGRLEVVPHAAACVECQNHADAA